MKLNIQEIRKQPEGLHFEQVLDLAADLRNRNQEILDVKDILAVGKVQYEDRMYFLDYQLSYTIVLASSRSMEPVELKESYLVNEIFMEEGHILFFKPVDQLLKESQQDNVSQAVMYYLKKSGRQL